VDGSALCRMFSQAIYRQSVPKYLSSDNDPLFRFHQWQANLRVLDVKEIKTVPYVPMSHPFVERLVGTIRRECLDRTLFWTVTDLESKLLDFKDYFNRHRTHTGLTGRTPEQNAAAAVLNFSAYRWRQHCRGLYQTPTPPDFLALTNRVALERKLDDTAFYGCSQNCSIRTRDTLRPWELGRNETSSKS